MLKPKILLIYSNEKDRKFITTLLHDNNFTVERTLHLVEKNSELDFCPEVVLIQTALYQYDQVVTELKTRFPHICDIYVKPVLNTQCLEDPYSEEIINFLRSEAIHKKDKLIDFIKQIEEKPFNKTMNCYELQL